MQAFKTNQRVKIINTTNLARSYKEFLEGKNHFIELSGEDFLVQAFETQPLEGISLPPNFPNCCVWHKRIFEQAGEMLNEFPTCCDNHRRLLTQRWFNKMEYLYLPQKVVKTIAYTLHCIDTCAANKDWFKEITDYIDYNIKSYGQFPFGYGPPLGIGQYLSCIESNIVERESLDEFQKEKLLLYIEKASDPASDERPSDLKNLIDIYKKWLRLFPFNISYLSHLKSHFNNMLPLLRGPIDTNIYTGLTSSRLIQKKELLQFLTDITRDIIKKINALEAFKNGQLGNREKTRLEIANARHQIKIEQLSVIDGEGDKAYLKVIKKWLKHERDYIAELTEIISDDYTTQTFILNVIDGMQQLQSGDTNEHCLLLVRNHGEDRESQVRYWFRNFLKARYKGADVTAEEENGPGRMDLKLFHPNMGLKIIEFKGWWNQDKKGVTKQLTNYLTDAQPEGFIFMINHLKTRDITNDYRKIVENVELGYLEGTWKTHKLPNTAIVYHESNHRSATTTKTLYHFILNVFF